MSEAELREKLVSTIQRWEGYAKEWRRMATQASNAGAIEHRGRCTGNAAGIEHCISELKQELEP